MAGIYGYGFNYNNQNYLRQQNQNAKQNDLAQNDLEQQQELQFNNNAGNTGSTGGSGSTGNTGGSGSTGNTGGSGDTGNTGGTGGSDPKNPFYPHGNQGGNNNDNRGNNDDDQSASGYWYSRGMGWNPPGTKKTKAPFGTALNKYLKGNFKIIVTDLGKGFRPDGSYGSLGTGLGGRWTF